MNFSTIRRVFNGIGDKVNDHLLQAHFITEGYSAHLTLVKKFHLGMGLLQYLQNMTHQLVEGKFFFVKFQFATFNFRNIEQVGNQDI